MNRFSPAIVKEYKDLMGKRKAPKKKKGKKGKGKGKKKKKKKK